MNELHLQALKNQVCYLEVIKKKITLLENVTELESPKQ